MPACGPCSGGPRLSLATYRIHLGTFAAHASFGAQLTSLPEAPERVTSVLDPLVGSEGSWLHEVMKKVAVLSLDASITDSVFRRQIQGGR